MTPLPRRRLPDLRLSLRRALQRCGFLPRAVDRTLWIHGVDAAAFRAAEPLVERLAGAFPRLGIRRVTGDRETWLWLRELHPADSVLAAPFELRPFVRRFVARVRPNTIVLLGERSHLGPRALARARYRRAAVARVGKRDLASPDQVLAGLRESVAREHAPRPLRAGDLKKRLARSSFGRRMMALRTDRIDDFDALAERLGRPRTILCLGNGPSSEDPRLREIEHDVLFRVNWRWLERGFLTHPDVVFTGDPHTLLRVPRGIYVFRTRREEEKSLRRMLLEPRPLRIRHLTYERVSGFLNEDWGARPSNGAVMLATAVALRPVHLVIAGIDLFADPAGSYPGDATTPNAYSPVHDRDVELRIAARALAEHRGEVRIFGDTLDRALREGRP